MEYQNGIFTFQGRINRLTYILQNILWNTLGIPFIYYSELVTYANFNPSYATPFMLIRWFFFIPLRVIDLRRIRDILDRDLTISESIFIVVILSLPYVDFFTTIFLSSVKPFYFAKSKFEGEIKKLDQDEANRERQILLNKQLFESGQISRSIYEARRDDLKKRPKA